ncbi:MAG: 16S rRNA (adenine(1518)-N(6)/adenine(1519)-N(6))-dimethyltransferase RsmA [Cellvibrionaceae bacterium]
MASPQDHALFKHRARKRFGQNFLNDTTIIEHIVRSISPKPDDNLVEIGPGQGAITAPLLSACDKLNVIEIDQDLIPILLAQFANYKDFKIHREDALKFDFSVLAATKPLRIVGNLPYNISTPLIFHLLSFQDKIADMHFMLQKEVVERLASEENEKHYGRLSVMVQYYCQVEYLFEVPPESFDPQPKVDSAIVKLTPHTTLPYVANDISILKKLVNTCFQQRRKTLRNSLKKLITQEQMDALTIDTSLRPENISVKEYVELSNIIANYS